MAAMGGNIGCVCMENRHDEVDPETMALQAALCEELSPAPASSARTPSMPLSTRIHQADFANAATPRTDRQTLAEILKRRTAAQSWLAAACNRGDPDAIQNAIVWAKDVGVSQAEIDDASATVTRLGARRRARDALTLAMEERDEASLREAVTLADEAGIDSSEIEQAVELIEELEQSGSTSGSADEARRQALVSLEKAMSSRGQQELQKAIAEAELAGLGTKSERVALSQARVMLNIVNARKEAAQRRRAQDRNSSLEDAIGKTPCGANAA